METYDETDVREQNEETDPREIAELAYSYWEGRGCEDGHDVEDWLAAEEEIRRRRAFLEETPRVRQARTAA